MPNGVIDMSSEIKCLVETSLNLGILKTMGDLIGPMTFAVFMGTARAIYGKHGEKIKLETFMLISAFLCVISYIT